MGRDSNPRGNGSTPDPHHARFGWRPDDDPSLVPAAPSTLPDGRQAVGHAAERRVGSATNGHLSVQQYWDEPVSTVDPNLPVRVTINFDDALPITPEAKPARPRRRGSQPALLPARLPRVVLHLAVLATIIGVVLGRGYWDRSPQPIPPRPSQTSADLRLGELPSGEALLASSSQAFALASSSSDVMAGYVSQLASAVVPDQLQLTVVVAREGETIEDIANKTGRSIDTLLWANGMRNPARPLAVGTQVRVPPVDGMLHVVHDGDTLESIAARYKVEVSAITGYEPNNVQSSVDLVPYRTLMIPGGDMPTRDQVVTYIVRQGDTLSTIAQYFGLHPMTIVWANSLPDGNLIFPGQQLAILPTDGLMAQVHEEDSIESLAEHYGVEPQAIRDYPMNGLGAGGSLRVGQWVMIPGGEPPAPPPPPPAPDPPPAAASNPAPAAESDAPAQQPAPQPSGGARGYFIWPTNGAITQYYGPTNFWMEPAYLGYAHFHQGLDVANNAYTPIVAADGGRVVFAGWSTVGYGFAVSIDHGNGYVTWYGHMAQQPAVSVGQWVSQGQFIGPMGTTGASTGSHLHFGLLRNGAWDDPLKYLQ